MKKKSVVKLLAIVTLSSMLLAGCGTKVSAEPVEIELGTELSDNILDYVAFDGGIDETALVEAQLNIDTVDIAKIGDYTATVVYDGQTVEVPVKVIDTTAPELSEDDTKVNEGEVVEAEKIAKAEDLSGTVTLTLVDSDGNALTDLVAEPEMTVTVMAVDASGNSTSLDIALDVILKDSVAPVIDGASEKIELEVGDELDLMAGVTATDDVDGDVTANIVTDGEVDTNTAGTYTVTYKVSDKAGNEASVEREVEVTKVVASNKKKTTTKTTTEPAKTSTSTAATTQPTTSPADVSTPSTPTTTTPPADYKPLPTSPTIATPPPTPADTSNNPPGWSDLTPGQQLNEIANDPNPVVVVVD